MSQPQPILTFFSYEEFSNRVANYLLQLNYQHGDCVALFMENRLEYVGFWLGCAKIGVVPALINAHLTGQTIIHSLNSAENIRAVIYGVEMASSM